MIDEIDSAKPAPGPEVKSGEKAPPPARPLLRVANHRARVTRRHQLELLERAKRCWDAIHSGHIFSDLSREDNDAHCELLDVALRRLLKNRECDDAWFSEVTRPKLW